MLKRNLLILLSALALTSAVQAHEFKLGDIQIGHPYARATVPQQTSGGAFLALENTGKTDDKLIKVESSMANSVEIHNMEMVGDVMKMREVDLIDLKAGSKISMKPGGGYHIMLIGLKKQLNAGDKFPLTLQFEKAGKIEVMVFVEANTNTTPAASDMHDHH
ncbi:copper chaperone PCu(A)C [Solimicrobium silvestre]|uniref:Copper chaperone PCu(A)C n=1 Tax=Solimicrobium silvestre TaxID=2099400 RepID=A0A2S9H1G4_9BURK|nr:copper chaperone PCu(A)C [Solimicrobium silvestre]PRC93706.1 hypothetical protein S2091_1707 [Solimicrobium silvestre]